jgi:phytoene dehydrogenase-like protein
LRHNPHANYLAYGAVNPVERDFDLGHFGLSTVTPEAQHGMAFSDGRPPLILHRNDLIERSVDSLRAYSHRDARTYEGLKARVMDLDPLMAMVLYSAPAREMAEKQIYTASRLIGRDISRLSAKSVIDSLFEADEVRAFFYQLAAETGLLVDTEGSAVGFLIFTLWLVGQWRLPIGGMQTYADALLAAARRAGVNVVTNAVADRIIVRDGIARAVVIAGHGQIVARRAIASSAGLAATLLGLVPKRTLSGPELASVNAYAAQDGPSLGSLVFGLRATPHYRSSRWDPAINRCFRIVIGYESAAQTLAHLREIERHLLPAPAAALRVNSLWDASQAPPGLHVAGGDVLMPAPSALDPESWSAVADSYVQAFVTIWGQYAANVSSEMIVAGAFRPPQPYERALRLKAGSDQYRTEIAQLYLCGASTYPGGGVHGACGYNAFAAIAEDLRLAMPT